MKGQIFIMTAVLVLIALILLKNTIQPTEIKSKNFLYERFNDLKNELIRTVDISILNQEDIAMNLNGFIDFSKDVFKQRGYNETIEFEVSTYGNTTEIHMNVSLELENSFIEDNFIINRTVYP